MNDEVFSIQFNAAVLYMRQYDPPKERYFKHCKVQKSETNPPFAEYLPVNRSGAGGGIRERLIR
jgi:hypothetical protein